MKTPSIRLILLIIMTFLLLPVCVKSQYFGRNKPTYKSFEFDVIKTPNFDIYTYTEDGITESLELTLFRAGKRSIF